MPWIFLLYFPYFYYIVCHKKGCFSRYKAKGLGNGKGHPIPLFKGLELRELLIIGGVRFKVLEDYVRQSLFFYKGRKKRKKAVLKVVSIRDKYQLDLGSNRESYESSRIWATRQGLWWKWQRVREWFSEFSESYEIQ